MTSPASAPLRTRVRRILPRGRTLPRDIWLKRHRSLVALLATLGAGIFVFAQFEGRSVGDSILEAGAIEAFALAAWVLRDLQRLAATLCSVGLVSTSALAVHISGGYIEAHFLFVVMVILLTLYEDWIPLLIAGAYVLLHHGYVGLTDPADIYNHADAIAHPIKWAAIHAALVTAAGAAGVAAWRLNESDRAATEDAYRQARRSERSMAEAQELADIGGFEHDLRTGEALWSPHHFRIFGFDPVDGPPRADVHLARFDKADRAAMLKALETAIERQEPLDRQYRYHHPDGSVRVIHARAEITFEDGKPARLIGTSQDVTDRERAHEVALRRAEMQRVVAELGGLALSAIELDRLFYEATTTVADILSVETVLLTELEPDGENFVVVAEAGLEDSLGARYPGGKASQSGFTLETGQPVVVQDWDREDRFGRSAIIDRARARSSVSVIVRRRDGVFGIFGVLSTEPHKFDVDDVSFVQAIANVLSAAIDRVEVEVDMRHRALHDPLTGLPNRVLFLDRLGQALAASTRQGCQVGVLFCDLDQFKLVNDSLGHEAGDELLTKVAPRLATVLRAGDTVARFGGDEFGIIVAEAESIHDITRVAERLATALATPFMLSDHEYFVSASVGIAVSGGGDPPETLIRDADLAMYRAKEKGRGRYEIFDHLMRSRAVDHLRTENDLRRALSREELVVHYQPVVWVSRRQIIGYEALVRWQHPERGLLGPGEFIPVAEESELIVELGERVLELACAQAARWHAERPDAPPVTMSVNVSPRQMADRSLPERVHRVLRETGLDPFALSLEITESVLVDEAEALDSIIALKELGIRLVLDDFGTGFSALGYLQRFPFDQLKIDRSFVQRLDQDPATAAIVQSVTSIADALGLAVVAEGIETEAQLAIVAELGCNFAQGFLFARPMPPEEAIALLAAPAKIA